jgi:ABC-type uncharacterized transport system substrate-binding protein
MKRAAVLLILVAAMLLAVGVSAEAQQPKKVHHIGYLFSGTVSSSAPMREAFLDGLRQLGYVENQDVSIEYRYADGRNDRLAALAEELVRLKVEVIVATGTTAPLAARHATTTIPIVASSSSGLLEKGLAESLAQPGGNVTGISTMGVDLIGKRLEIFREAFPKVRRLAVLWFKEGNVDFQEIRNAAQPFGFNSSSFEVARTEDLDNTFALIRRERFDGLFPGTSAFLNTHRKRVIGFAAKNRLPAIYYQELFVEDGGLMSYSASIKDSYRHAAVFVDKILKGAKPSDLPVEQPRKFELWINLKAANQIGPDNSTERAGASG